jgi:hypothetical protein
MASIVEGLRKLGYRYPTGLDGDEFTKQLAPGGSDRGACLLVAAQLETELEAAIEATIGPFSDEIRGSLVEQDGPAATFARKIVLASALGILGPDLRHNFRLVRHIRNAFAHARIPIKFETPEIEMACNDLRLINPVPPHDSSASVRMNPEPRLFFEEVVAAMLITVHGYVRQRLSEKRTATVPILP